MRNLLFLLLLCIPLVTWAQEGQQVIEGYVKDKHSGAAVPYASVRIEKSNIGTLSNAEGRFIIKAPLSLSKHALLVSSIGYTSWRSVINDLPKEEALRITLQPSAGKLDEVIVSNETPAEIVAHAYRNISLNYPLTNTFYTGFYRESNLHIKPGTPEQYFYVIEAVTSMNKPSYQSVHPEGEIKLEQVRKSLFTQNDHFAKWFAGVFTPIRFDVVKKRFDFIDPAYADRYKYTKEGLTTYYDQPVYIIRFTPRKHASFEGTLYIQPGSYAIVKADYHLTASGLNDENIFMGIDIATRQFKINYQPVGEKWLVQSVWQQATGHDDAARDSFRYVTEYAVTKTDTSHYESFEYGDKMQYGDVFLDKPVPYHEDFWKDYNIVAETQTLKGLLIDTVHASKIATAQIQATQIQATANKPTVSSVVKKRWFQRLRPIYVPFNGAIVHNNTSTMSIQYTNAAGDFQVNQAQALHPNTFAVGIGYGLEYDVYKDLTVSIRRYAGLSHLQDNATDIGIGYSLVVSPSKKRPVRLLGGIDYSFTSIQQSLGDFNNASHNIVIDGQTFTRNTITVALRSRQQGIKPRLGISLEINHAVSLFAEAGYYIPFSNSDVLRFIDKPKNIFQSAKNKDLSLTGTAIDFRTDGQPTNELPYEPHFFFNVGIKGWVKFLR